MRSGTLFYGLWCAGIAAAFLFATNYAWSPFADASRPVQGTRTGGGGGGIIFIPTHK